MEARCDLGVNVRRSPRPSAWNRLWGRLSSITRLCSVLALIRNAPAGRSASPRSNYLIEVYCISIFRHHFERKDARCAGQPSSGYRIKSWGWARSPRNIHWTGGIRGGPCVALSERTSAPAAGVKTVRSVTGLLQEGSTATRVKTFKVKNYQLSRWFDGEPLKAVLRDSATFGMGFMGSEQAGPFRDPVALGS